ncbi:MAG TPA: glycosyltransferase, partial [Puia sp.]|nr:glycosyltransferase [Puia sp.]
SMRAYLQIKKKGNELLQKEKFDLVFFSTTAFHVMALGPGWKRKFGVPFVLDFQDPWRNDYYLSKPVSERPPKFFISYRIDKKLERATVPNADGIISVSKAYCDTFKERYNNFQHTRCRVIPFGASKYDFEIMQKKVHQTPLKLIVGKTNIVYIGRGGHDMKTALEIVFKSFKIGLRENPLLFKGVHFSFVGTSYALPGQGQKTIEPLAEEIGIKEYVTEITDRIPYFDTLYLLKKADILLVPGSNDNSYTASKIYPYILAEKPMLALFHKDSSVITVLKELGIDGFVTFDSTNVSDELVGSFYRKMKNMLENKTTLHLDHHAFEPYTAKSRTKEQADFFDEVVGSTQEKKL